MRLFSYPVRQRDPPCSTCEGGLDRARSVGEFWRSLHGGGSVEGGGALVVEAAAALSVDDVGGVLGVGRIDQVEACAAGEPPAPLPVEVLDLTALPRRVRIAEPAVDPVGRSERRPFGPLGALIERDRNRRCAGIWSNASTS